MTVIPMSERSRQLAFLLSSFVSAVGDSLLVLAVPAGLGLETNDLRSAVLMWLIPAVAIFISTFMYKIVEKRKGSTRIDYGFLILAVALLELLIATASLFYTSRVQSLL